MKTAVIPVYSCFCTWPYRQKLGRDFYGRNLMAIPVKQTVRSPTKDTQAALGSSEANPPFPNVAFCKFSFSGVGFGTWVKRIFVDDAELFTVRINPEMIPPFHFSCLHRTSQHPQPPRHIGQCNNYLTYLNVVINDIMLIMVAAGLSLKQHLSRRSQCSLIGYKVT